MNISSEEGMVAAVDEFPVETASVLPRRLTFGFTEDEHKREEKKAGKDEVKEAAVAPFGPFLQDKPKRERDTSRGRRLSIDQQQWHEQLSMIPCEHCQGKMKLQPGVDSPLRQEGEFHAVLFECSACKRPARRTNGSEERCRGLRAPESEKKLAVRRGKRRRQEEKDDGRPRAAGNGRIQQKVRAGPLKVNMRAALAEAFSGVGSGRARDRVAIGAISTLGASTCQALFTDIWHAVTVVAESELKKVILSHPATAKVIVCVDGAWSQRREARHHCFVMLDSNDRPLFIAPLSKDRWGLEKDGQTAKLLRRGNYHGSSKPMETAGWEMAKRDFDAIDPSFRNKVVAVCGDQDSSLPRLVADCFPNAEIVYDPGHYAKTIRKALEQWIPVSNPLTSISGRFMKTITTLQKKAKELADADVPVPTHPPCPPLPDIPSWIADEHAGTAEVKTAKKSVPKKPSKGKTAAAKTKKKAAVKRKTKRRKEQDDDEEKDEQPDESKEEAVRDDEKEEDEPVLVATDGRKKKGRKVPQFREPGVASAAASTASR